MKYYLCLTLLIAPLTTGLLALLQYLPWSLPCMGDALLALPSTTCCAIHLWVRKSRIWSLGTLYACILLPCLAATLYCIYAHSQAPGQSMIGMLYLITWLVNFLATALLLLLSAILRMLH